MFSILGIGGGTILGSALAEKAYETADAGVADSSIKLASVVSAETEPAKLNPSWLSGVYTREATTVETTLDYTSYDLAKRAFDLVSSTLLLAILSPIMLLVAIIISIESPGSPVYTQTRIGKNGTPFTMYKFRSMCADADAKLEKLRDYNEATGPMFKIADDPRVTSFGKFIRTFSIDELPQLINIIIGDMSVVGPRPPLPAEVDNYSSHEMRRLQVLPGLTGYWQISGRSDLTFENCVALDLEYIKERSMATDLKTILKTVPVVILKKGAY